MSFLARQTPGMGIHVEGWVVEGAASGGVVLYHGTPPDSHALTWIEGLVAPPERAATSIDPVSGTHDVSTHTFRISLTHAALAWAQGTPAAVLESAIGTVTTTLQAAAGALTAPGYAYLGDETVRLVSLDSSSSGVDTFTITRAQGGSVAGTYDRGATVYTGAPDRAKRRGRIVTLYETRDPSVAPEVIWVGAIVRTRVDQAAGVVELLCDEYLSVLARRELGRAAPALSTARLDLGPVSATGAVDVPESHAPINPTSGRAFVQIGDVVVSLDAGSRAYTTPTGTWRTYLGERGVFDGDPGPGYEVLYASRAENVTSFEGASDPWHLVSVCLCMMLSTGTGANDPAFGTYDVLGRAWGLGVPVSRIDGASWEAAISSTPGLVIDQIHGGFGGEVFRAWEWIKESLRVAGFFVARTLEGKLSCVRYGPPRTEDLGAILSSGASAFVLPGEVTIEGREETAIGMVSGELGASPWGGPATIEVREPAVESLQRLEADAGYELASGARPQAFRLPWLARTSRARAERLLWQRYADRKSAPPELVCTLTRAHPDTGAAEAGGTLPAPGSYLRLYGASRWRLVGADGADVDINAAGLVAIVQLVAVDLDYRRETAPARVVLWGYARETLGRRIAPAAVSVSAAGAVLTVSELVDASGFSGFSDGDELVLTDVHGRRVDSVLYTLSGYVAGSMTLTPNPPNASGLYVRLADVDDYDNAGWSGATLVSAPGDKRQWAYVSDADARLGAGDDQGDVWS